MQHIKYSSAEFKILTNKNNWELIDSFSDGITRKYTFKCRMCENVQTFWGHYMIKPHVNPQCKICLDKKDSFNKRLEFLESSLRITSKEKVTSVNKPIMVKCLLCEHEYETQIRIIFRGSGCPNCNILKQRNVNLMLNKFNINYKEFKNACRKIQRYNIINYTLFNMEDIGKFNYHIDHKYSLRDCFDNNVPIHIASSPVNLQKLWWEDNIKKNKISCITMDKLLLDHVLWLNLNGGEDKYLKAIKMSKIEIDKNLLNFNHPI